MTRRGTPARRPARTTRPTSPVTRPSGKQENRRGPVRAQRPARSTPSAAEAFAALNGIPGARAYYDHQRARGVRATAPRCASSPTGLSASCTAACKTRTLYDEATAWPQLTQPRSQDCGLTFKLLGCLITLRGADRCLGERLSPYARIIIIVQRQRRRRRRPRKILAAYPAVPVIPCDGQCPSEKAAPGDAGLLGEFLRRLESKCRRRATAGSRTMAPTSASGADTIHR